MADQVKAEPKYQIEALSEMYAIRHRNSGWGTLTDVLEWGVEQGLITRAESLELSTTNTEPTIFHWD